MRKEKCRLCLCTSYNLAGISSSITDDSFEAIIRSVFPFALPPFDTVDGKKTDLPVLVCFQCSNTIRHFHYFSEHVKANQEKLRSISDEDQPIQPLKTPISENWSIHELIDQIKRESEDNEVAQIAENDEELVSTNPDDERPPRPSSIPPLVFIHKQPFAYVSNKEIVSPNPLTLTEPTLALPSLNFFGNQCVENSDPLTITEPQLTQPTPTVPLFNSNGSQCVEKSELAGTLETMDKRVDIVTKKLGLLIRNLGHTQRLTKKRRPDHLVSFEFTPMKNQEEVDSFNEQLSEENYRSKVFDWMDNDIDADDSKNRMHQAIDLLFDRAFFAKCGWTGVKTRTGNPKVGLRNYKLVLKLFQDIGRTDREVVTARELEQFLQQKLYHAKSRINMSRLKTKCHKMPRKITQEFKEVSK